MTNDPPACLHITSPYFLLRDEVLQAREAQRCRFELAKDRQQRAREARDLLILSLYTHLPPSRGLEVRTLELVWERELEEPFEQARYRDRNVALVKKEGGIMLHLGMFKTVKHTGTETIPIQVILIVTSSSYANKSRVSRGIFSRRQIALPPTYPIKVQTT